MEEHAIPRDVLGENSLDLPTAPVGFREDEATDSSQATVPGNALEPAQPLPRRRKNWLWLVGCVVLFLALVVVVGLLARGRVARAFYNWGEACYARGDHDQAIVEYGRAIQLMPDYAAAFVGRAMAYAQLEDYERAIADLDRSNAELAEAVAELDQAITLNPKNARAYRLHGDAYLAKGDLSRAMADYDRALKLRPGDAQAHDGRGLAQAQKEASAEAISFLHQYRLDQFLTDEDDPRLWAAAVRKHDLPDCFGIGTEDRANEVVGMMNLETQCFGGVEERHLRAISHSIAQSCPNDNDYLYISRPSAGMQYALVHDADFGTTSRYCAGCGRTTLWIRQEDGSWQQTETGVAVWCADIVYE